MAKEKRYVDILELSMIPGIAAIIQSKSCNKFSFRVVILLCAVTGFVWQTKVLVEEYLTYPTVLHIEERHITVTRLPGVTFCYANGRQIYRPISKKEQAHHSSAGGKSVFCCLRKEDPPKNCCQTFEGRRTIRTQTCCVSPIDQTAPYCRLQWCREHHNWTEQDWTCVLFSDESRFNLSSDCRRQLIWRESGTAYHRENIQEKDRYPTCSIMVWAGIMIKGRTRLHVVANGTMTGQRYIDEVLLPHVRLFRGAVGDKFVFMDDNATYLNPIENVWDTLGRQVAGRNYPPINKNTLIRALTEEWDKLPQQLLDNVVQSMGVAYCPEAGCKWLTVKEFKELNPGEKVPTLHNDFLLPVNLSEIYLLPPKKLLKLVSAGVNYGPVILPYYSYFSSMKQPHAMFIGDHTIEDASVCDTASRVVAVIVSKPRVQAGANVIELFVRTLVVM
ncbi:transposable element Tcb2 transposase [Trichonephila clavipes]|nr:transposable element Tcb2 transposase [Trichonephila clavipes]